MSSPSKSNRRQPKAVRRPEATTSTATTPAAADEHSTHPITSDGDPRGWLAITVVGSTLVLAAMLTLLLVAASGNT